uniref:Uncharacterized protein n=1 Tax=Anguilla anguilla TaxID=7936 RepID=A0A0E9PES5_ANGAN
MHMPLFWLAWNNFEDFLFCESESQDLFVILLLYSSSSSFFYTCGATVFSVSVWVESDEIVSRGDFLVFLTRSHVPMAVTSCVPCQINRHQLLTKYKL